MIECISIHPRAALNELFSCFRSIVPRHQRRNHMGQHRNGNHHSHTDHNRTLLHNAWEMCTEKRILHHSMSGAPVNNWFPTQNVYSLLKMCVFSRLLDVKVLIGGKWNKTLISSLSHMFWFLKKSIKTPLIKTS